MSVKLISVESSADAKAAKDVSPYRTTRDRANPTTVASKANSQFFSDLEILVI
jgi:hypothetical protein